MRFVILDDDKQHRKEWQRIFDEYGKKLKSRVEIPEQINNLARLVAKSISRKCYFIIDLEWDRGFSSEVIKRGDQEISGVPHPGDGIEGEHLARALQCLGYKKFCLSTGRVWVEFWNIGKPVNIYTSLYYLLLITRKIPDINNAPDGRYFHSTWNKQDLEMEIKELQKLEKPSKYQRKLLKTYRIWTDFINLP